MATALAEPAAVTAAPAKRRRLPIVRTLICVLLGVLATFAVSAATARWLPFTRPGAGIAGAGSTRWTDQLMDSVQRVEVAAWGDHLKPWHIRVSSPAASRLSWFEKGRVYSNSRGSPQASSAAVSCWSFATGCWSAVNSATTGPLPAPPELSESNNMHRTWATAIEVRGWPFRAFTCRISAPMGGGAGTTAPVYTVDGGYWIDQRDTARHTEAIQALRVIPLTPLWPGLFADSVFFAAIFFALSFIPIAIHRLAKPKGFCPKCRYDLRPTGGEQAGCPECGWNRAATDPPLQATGSPKDQ